MALSYQESAELMRDTTFLSRVKVACLHFAAYIWGEDAAVPAHNTRLRWAQSVMQSADTVAGQITPTVVMDDKVQADGGAITDTDLQVAVETAVNKLL